MPRFVLRYVAYRRSTPSKARPFPDAAPKCSTQNRELLGTNLPLFGAKPTIIRRLTLRAAAVHRSSWWAHGA
jgi:hypothetical protein